MKNLTHGLMTAALALTLPYGAWAGEPKSQKPEKKPAAAGKAAPKESPAIQKARALFEKYQRLSDAFNPAVADLYADDAVIESTRIYPTGETKRISIPASRWKALVRQAMPLAKNAGDTNVFLDCRYTEAGERVQIACTRSNKRKSYTSPYQMVVGPGPGADWVIHAEHTETRP